VVIVSIESPEQLNGQHQSTPVRVRFGPNPTQDMPLPWAEFILNEMREAQANGRKPEPFGALLARAAMECGR
jgi:hypothetical protein